jgi:hypothetical protein
MGVLQGGYAVFAYHTFVAVAMYRLALRLMIDPHQLLAVWTATFRTLLMKGQW